MSVNNAVFEKTMENVRKHRDIKLVATENRRNHLNLGANYHTTDWLAIQMKKTQLYMNKPSY